MKVIKGNIFKSKCQTIVNAVNCVGVMGAGIAYEYKLRYPEMYKTYTILCKNKMLHTGSLSIFKSEDKWILNFPTKFHWKDKSRIEYLEQGLQKFVDTYKEKKITSVAFPLLGTGNGGISEDTAIDIMKKYLEKCEIKVEVYRYDPEAYDDLFFKFKKALEDISEDDFRAQSDIRIVFIRKLKLALAKNDIRNISKLSTVKGIGNDTVEKIFLFIIKHKLFYS